MKLEPESRKQLLRIAGGTAICTAAMWVLFAALHLVGWVRFDYTVVLASLVGAAVAIGNFAGICFVVQKIIDEPDEKKRKATLQLSYNSRMLLQAVWVVVAIAAPCFQPFAGVLPLFVAGAVGLGAALAVPGAWLRVVFPPPAPPVQTQGLSGAARRLAGVADTLSDIADTVNAVCTRQMPPKGENFDFVVEHIARTTCQPQPVLGAGLCHSHGRAVPTQAHAGEPGPRGGGGPARAAVGVHPPGGPVYGGQSWVSAVAQPPPDAGAGLHAAHRPD